LPPFLFAPPPPWVDLSSLDLGGSSQLAVLSLIFGNETCADVVLTLTVKSCVLGHNRNGLQCVVLALSAV